MKSTQLCIRPCSRLGFFPLIPLLLVQTMKRISILQLCMHWCDQETFCAGFAKLELEASAWLKHCANVNPREQKTVPIQQSTFRQYLICVIETCGEFSAQAKYSVCDSILTDSIIFTHSVILKVMACCWIQDVMCCTGHFLTCLHPVWKKRREERHVKVICVCLKVPGG